MVTRKDLIESQLLRHCRRMRRKNRGDTTLLESCLSTSQQLPPLILPSSRDSHVWNENNSYRLSNNFPSRNSDHSMMDSSFISNIGDSIRGGDENAQLLSLSHPPSEERGFEPTMGTVDSSRGGSGTLLSWFFPSSSFANEADQLSNRATNIDDSNTSQQSSTEFSSSHGGMSYGRVRLTK